MIYTFLFKRKRYREQRYGERFSAHWITPRVATKARAELMQTGARSFFLGLPCGYRFQGFGHPPLLSPGYKQRAGLEVEKPDKNQHPYEMQVLPVED